MRRWQSKVPVRPPKRHRSSSECARRGRAAHTQIPTHHICFNNRRRAYTRQGKQTPNIDQRKHTETRKHQPTHANPKKPDPSLRTARSVVGGSALITCRLPGYFAARFRICNGSRCPPTGRKPNWVVPPNEAMAIQSTRSSLRNARRERVAHTQIPTHHICFNNRRRAYTRQSKHAETGKHQPTHTNPKT
jgi:hypothetical protein